jgi:transcriptional regulator with XRE-family HTH domain
VTDELRASIDAAIAEPADYDPASRSAVFITDPQSLALALRRMRRHMYASQRAFAAAAGVSRTTVARIETCDVDPTVGMLSRLVGAAGLSLAITGLGPTSFMFSIVDRQRDGAGRHAPPHRLSPTGVGWWDPSLKRPIEEAVAAHQADLQALMSVAAARSRDEPPR